jgi:hypothetical protein
MQVKRHIVLYIITFPWDVLIAWPVVLLIRLFWGKDLRWETPPSYDRHKGGGGGPCLTCQIKPDTFPVTKGTFPKGWYLHRDDWRPWGGTALGHGVFYGPTGRKGLEDWTRTQAHEHVHVEQFEVSMLRSFLVGLGSGIVLLVLGHPVAALATFSVIWFFGYAMMGIAGALTSLLRGTEAYWGATHEESARAQTDRLV